MIKTARTVPAKSVNEYLNGQPAEVRDALEKLRNIIKAAAPEAEEVISYQVPTFKYNGTVVCFAAFKNHCSFYTTSHTIMQAFKEELKPYDTSGVTIHFTVDKPLPASLIRKLVKARIKENEVRLMAKKPAIKKESKALIKKNDPARLTDKEKVDEYMNRLDHPLKAEIEAVRKIIKNADKKIAERIKWNAPSYYYNEDMVTFHPRAQDCVHLVFHHPAIATIKSPILKGDYKDRRMIYLRNMKEIQANKTELESVIKELVKIIDK